MAEAFLQLSARDRVDALGVAADASGRPASLLEKDVWVVWSLAALFGAPFRQHLSFKGGTSLSKAYRVIRRFSEDVDVTHDIRALLPDLGDAEEPVPPSRSQEQRWTKQVRKRLENWVADDALPTLQSHLKGTGAVARIRAKQANLYVDYDSVAGSGTGYVKPEVLIEFGGRATGEPAHEVPVACDAAAHLPSLEFPTARPRVLAPERTFWEKATAIHVFCLQGPLQGERYARHWYDLVKLDDAGVAERAMLDRDLAVKVAQHKRWFFRETDAHDQVIDYAAAVQGSLTLVPDVAGQVGLRDDYERMLAGGLLEEGAPSFDEIISRCRSLEQRANMQPA
jgi:hypothetical protein